MSVLLYGLTGLGILIALGFVVTWVQLRVARSKASTAAAKTYATLQHPPKLRVQFSFGYPAITVNFRNLLVLEEAARLGLNNAFLQEIDRLFAGYGPKRRPFRAEAAVHFTHENFLTRADIGMR
jgi:hypothetical protein